MIEFRIMEQGKHNKRGETKKIIILYIVAKGQTNEPDIREYLRKYHNIKEKKNIREQLEGLLVQGCLEKDDADGRLPNRWDIEKIENVKNILEKFPELQHDLQRSPRIANLLLEKHQQLIKEPDAPKWFRTMLKISPAFFNMCMKHSSEKLLEIATKITNSKWAESCNFSSPIHTQILDDYKNKEFEQKPLQILFRSSILINYYIVDNYDENAACEDIPIEDIDELNFMIGLGMDFSVKMIKEDEN